MLMFVNTKTQIATITELEGPYFIPRISNGTAAGTRSRSATTFCGPVATSFKTSFEEWSPLQIATGNLHPKLHGMQQVASRRFPCKMPPAFFTPYTLLECPAFKSPLAKLKYRGNFTSSICLTQG